MTDTRTAALAAQELRNPDPSVRVAALGAQELRNPDPAVRVAAENVQVLQQLQKIVPPDVRLAAQHAQALGTIVAPTAQLAALGAQLLVELPPTLPDSGQPFQWHSPDPATPTGWVVDVDRSSALTAWQATTGRGDATGKPPPITVTLQLAAAFAAAPELGDVFRIVTTAAIWGTGLTGTKRVRWTGEVTDVVHDPRTGRIVVTGVGRLARNGRRPLDPRGYPTELDGARVARILLAAGADLGVLDGGAVKLLAPTEASTPASTLLDAVSESTTGLVVERRTGAVDYHDAEHRRGVPVTATLAATQVLSAFTWAKRAGDVVNVCDVGYGRAGESVRVVDHDSVDTVEEYPEQRSTLLVDASDAYALGSTIVGRRAWPAWQLPSVTVDLRNTITDPALRTQLLQLALGDRLRLTGLPPGGDFTEAELFVEGVTELVAVEPRAGDGDTRTAAERTSWLLTFSVSDPALSGVSLRWRDVPPDVAWDDVDPGVSWLDLSRTETPDVLTTPTP